MKAFMLKHRLAYPLDRMARALGFSRAAIYKILNRRPTARDKADENLKPQILSIFNQSRKTYGAPRLLQKLRKSALQCGTDRMRKLQKALQIQGSLRRRRKVQTTDSAHDKPISPNLLKRNFRSQKPNEVWVSDITYLRTAQGWLYLCVFLDLFSRRIVGWSMSDNLEAVNVCRALTMAIGRRQPPSGLIVHSDRGVQYASDEFRALLVQHGFTQSMSRKADCLDNAVAKSFFGTLKSELEANVFGSHLEARRVVFDYIECFYNTERLHSYLGYKSPVEFEQEKAA
jgi:transposase InsO family protein